MFVATVIATALLAAMLAFSAVMKLTHRPEVVESYLRAGVPEDRLNQLAAVLLAAAAALLAGLAWAPLGIAAGVGVVCYFLVAIAFHVRADDVGHLPTPVAVVLLAAASLALRIASS